MARTAVNRRVATSLSCASTSNIIAIIDSGNAGDRDDRSEPIETIRAGDTSTVPPVILSRRVVAVHILLPYFSPGGKYVVSITTDRNGSAAKAEGSGTANVNGFHADLSVTLDLRNLPGGTCYLATTHEADRASYYYPLAVR
jgi:hypothetical protein